MPDNRVFRRLLIEYYIGFNLPKNVETLTLCR